MRDVKRNGLVLPNVGSSISIYVYIKTEVYITLIKKMGANLKNSFFVNFSGKKKLIQIKKRGGELAQPLPPSP